MFRYVTPAPGAYEASNTNAYKHKNPAYSLSTRYNVPTDHTMKPGPGAYTPEKVWREAEKKLKTFGFLKNAKKVT